MEGVRYKHNSALNQVGVKLGSKLNLENFSILSLLGQEDSGPKMIHGDKLVALECVENVEH
jgi:hypothetical protein